MNEKDKLGFGCACFNHFLISVSQSRTHYCTLPQTLLQTNATTSNRKILPVLLRVNFYIEQFLNRQKFYTLFVNLSTHILKFDVLIFSNWVKKITVGRQALQ